MTANLLNLQSLTTRHHCLYSGALCALLFATGCGGGGDDGTTNPPPGSGSFGSFTMSASVSSMTIGRNGNASGAITIGRNGGFTGSVSLLATTAPTGVTVAFTPPQVSANETQSTFTVSVGGATALGTTTLRIQGTSVGQNMQTVEIQLTVTTPVLTGPFTLSMSASSHLVHPTNIQSTQPIVTITRNTGFTGAVAFTSSGLPPTLAIAFTPSSTTGNTTGAFVIPAGVTPNGTYTATIRGSSAQGDQTITFQVVVQSVSTGAIKWRFCSGSLPRYFFAVKDGNGPWTRIMPSGVDTSYSFSLTSGAGQVAEVNLEAGGFRTTIHSFTAQEMAARAASQCALYQHLTTRTANGSFGGVTGFRQSFAALGWWFGSANGNGSFTLLNLPPGALDLVAVRTAESLVHPSLVPADRMIIRRGINPASGSTIPVVDFGAAESFAPTTATWTFAQTIGARFAISQTFFTAGGTTGLFAPIPGVDSAGIQRSVFGVPLAQTVAGDLHQVVATVEVTGPVPSSPLRATRQIVAYARTLSNRTLNFGSEMPSPTVLPVQGTPAGRLRAQGTIPQEYNTGITFDVSQAASSNHITIHASRAFLGAGTGYDLTLPDLSGAIGWDTQFAIRAGSPVQWWASGGGPTLDFFDGRYQFNTVRSRWTGIMTGITLPADGATYLFARATGTVTP